MLDDIKKARDRHHELPRLQAARAAGAVGRRTCAARGRDGSGAADARNRRPDAPARDARADGHEERPGPERRGAPLLPREAAGSRRRGELKGDERKEAEKNNEAARLWISGLEAVNRKLGLARVFDLSATPFFLRGSGYAEGTLFPWTMSDFSLMDAIECGIVKLPRVPVADNIPGDEMPMLPQPLGAHPQGHAEEGARHRRRARSAQAADAAEDRARGAVRALREDVRAVAAARHLRAAVLHRRLPEHGDLEARVRLHLRLRPQARGRLDVTARAWAARAVPQLRRATAIRSRARTRC